MVASSCHVLQSLLHGWDANVGILTIFTLFILLYIFCQTLFCLTLNELEETFNVTKLYENFCFGKIAREVLTVPANTNATSATE